MNTKTIRVAIVLVAAAGLTTTACSRKRRGAKPPPTSSIVNSGLTSCTVYHDNFYSKNGAKDGEVHAMVFGSLGNPENPPNALDEVRLSDDEGTFVEVSGLKVVPITGTDKFYAIPGQTPPKSLERLASGKSTAQVTVGGQQESCQVVGGIEGMFDSYGGCPDCILQFICICLDALPEFTQDDPLCNGVTQTRSCPDSLL